MKKLAIFVEGYTEATFVYALLIEIAGSKNVLIQHHAIRGGTTTRRTMRQIKAARPATHDSFFVMIYDCGGDDLVKTRIQEEHKNLSQNQYARIIGIRDVRPKFTHADIPKLELGLRTGVKTSLIPVQFVLSVMEIEAWFLAEFNHFPLIDPHITIPAIKAALGFDPTVDDMTQRLTPADDLAACYKIAGKSYDITSTIAVLDYTYVYVELQNKIASVKILVDAIDGFLA